MDIALRSCDQWEIGFYVGLLQTGFSSTIDGEKNQDFIKYGN
jgi:hypothetical protein